MLQPRNNSKLKMESKMKFHLLAIIFCLMSTQVFAQGNGVLLWSCAKGDNSQAVTVSTNPDSSEDAFVVVISDRQILATLGFGASLFFSVAKELPNAEGYRALSGENTNGVDFIHDHGGMKLIFVSQNESGIQVDPSLNWYFNPGECVPH